jgi:hypothetical protein
MTFLDDHHGSKGTASKTRLQIRNPKFETISNDQKSRKFQTNRLRIRFSQLGFRFLGLFRISIFELRILFRWCPSEQPWRDRENKWRLKLETGVVGWTIVWRTLGSEKRNPHWALSGAVPAAVAPGAGKRRLA